MPAVTDYVARPLNRFDDARGHLVAPPGQAFARCGRCGSSAWTVLGRVEDDAFRMESVHCAGCSRVMT